MKQEEKELLVQELGLLFDRNADEVVRNKDLYEDEELMSREQFVAVVSLVLTQITEKRQEKIERLITSHSKQMENIKWHLNTNGQYLEAKEKEQVSCRVDDHYNFIQELKQLL